VSEDDAGAWLTLVELAAVEAGDELATTTGMNGASARSTIAARAMRCQRNRVMLFLIR
jgi:predicted deacylase